MWPGKDNKEEGVHNKTEIRKHWRKVLQKVQDIEVNNNDNTGEQFYQDEENAHENESTQADIEVLGERGEDIGYTRFNERQL